MFQGHENVNVDTAWCADAFPVALAHFNSQVFFNHYLMTYFEILFLFFWRVTKADERVWEDRTGMKFDVKVRKKMLCLEVNRKGEKDIWLVDTIYGV